MTSTELEQKQKAAEEKRKKELEKRATVGERLSKKERLRGEIQEARGLDWSQQKSEDLERKLSAGQEKRERIQEEVKQKQKLKEQHAKRVRVSIWVT